MTFPTSALVVVHLMTTLCATTLSEEIPLTCPDTARRPLTDISHVYDCKLWFEPEDNVPRCRRYLTGPFDDRIFFKFEILEEVPEGTAMCLGLKTLSVCHLLLDEDLHGWVGYDIDFNPLLAVGVLTADHNTSKTNRSYSISLLSDVLNLPIFSQFNVRDSSFWNFSSPLFGTQMNWIQSFILQHIPTSITRLVLERLKNTSIKTLNVKIYLQQGSMEILVRDLPFLRVMKFDGVGVNKFHKDSFLGMPQMEVLILQDTQLIKIPTMVDRMSKLKILKIVRSANIMNQFMVPTYQLSTLKDLEVLNLKYTPRPLFSRSLHKLLKLRILNLDNCKLFSIKKGYFERFPVLEELTLSNNKLTHLEENTFRPLKRLKLLDLSFNRLTNWPVLNDFSFTLLDMSHNLLSDIYNLGQIRTTVDILNISNNKILHWDDKYVFSNQKPLIPNEDQRKELNMTHSEDSNKDNIFTSGSKTKLLRRIPSNRSVVNFYDQTKLSKSEEGEKNTTDYSSHWVNTINISYNSISHFSQTMMQSLEGIHQVDLGGIGFTCVDCTMIPFQKWLNTTSTNVTNLGTLDPLLCSHPVTQRGTPVNLVQYDEEPCLEKVRTTSLLMLIGVPVGVISIFVATVGGVIYKYRLPISYMLHLYRIRRRALDFSRSAFNKHAFDAFVCYSSQDRRFVLTRLVPLLEKGEEGYCLCLHERDFPLGSYIVSNIIGSIQHSRKTIIVLSEHFVSSKWCNWELEMTQHKMFNEDEHFVILIQLEKLDRNELPRHLQFMMDTRTFLEWPPPGHDDEEDVAAERLKEALGPSILQTTREKPPALSDLMEDY